jgi:hypothetical protein
VAAVTSQFRESSYEAITRVFWFFKGSPGEPFSFSADAWHGWILSIIGAVLVLWITGIFHSRQSG